MNQAEYVTTILKIGNSEGITIPLKIREDLGLLPGEMVKVHLQKIRLEVQSD